MNESWWSWDHAAAVLPDLLVAFFKYTLVATVLGTLIAVVLGLVVAMVRRISPAIIRTPVTWVVEFIRMTPLVVQL
ncbi:MAG: ectoine/hydroxyectoine ABC transporter permease subunit EhuD, partial [Brachybacterium sp.]